MLKIEKTNNGKTIQYFEIIDFFMAAFKHTAFAKKNDENA